MKQSTTQDRAYLTECLKYHQHRVYEVGLIPIWERFAFLQYHRKQIRWFKAKIRSCDFRAEVPLQVVPYTPPAHELFTKEELDRLLAPTQMRVQEVAPTKREPWYIRAYNKLRGL